MQEFFCVCLFKTASIISSIIFAMIVLLASVQFEAAAVNIQISGQPLTLGKKT